MAGHTDDDDDEDEDDDSERKCPRPQRPITSFTPLLRGTSRTTIIVRRYYAVTFSIMKISPLASAP